MLANGTGTAEPGAYSESPAKDAETEYGPASMSSQLHTGTGDTSATPMASEIAAYERTPAMLNETGRPASGRPPPFAGSSAVWSVTSARIGNGSLQLPFPPCHSTLLSRLRIVTLSESRAALPEASAAPRVMGC